MRLVHWGQKEDFQPLDRGAAFPQFYENGDAYKPWNPFDFHSPYWLYFIHWSDFEWQFLWPRDVLAEALMMGGEL